MAYEEYHMEDIKQSENTFSIYHRRFMLYVFVPIVMCIGKAVIKVITWFKIAGVIFILPFKFFQFYHRSNTKQDVKKQYAEKIENG